MERNITISVNHIDPMIVTMHAYATQRKLGKKQPEKIYLKKYIFFFKISLISFRLEFFNEYSLFIADF